MREPTHGHIFSLRGGTNRTPLVLLHGSDGTESDLIDMADELAPAAPKLGIRGAVTTSSGYAFFRRFPDRRVDEEDMQERAPVLAEFIATSCANYGLTRRPIAIGFSNGAVMAAALLMTHPRLLAGAILFRPLSPFADDLPCHLDGMPVLIVDGRYDSRRSAGDGLRLAGRLRQSGALVTHRLLAVAHSITVEDCGIARQWLEPLLQ